MLIVCALCALVPPQGQPAAQFVPPIEQGPGVPMEVTSYHVPVVRNEFVTIFRIDIPPGRSSGYHIHDRDQVCTVVEDYPPEAYSQPLGGPPGKPRQAARGEVSYVAYFGKPMSHRAINAGVIPNHSICAVLSSAQTYGYTVGARNSTTYSQLLDNNRVRAWRLQLQPGQSAPPITQQAPALRVIIVGGEIVEVLPDRRERGMAIRTGEFYWKDAGATRGLRNIGTTPIEMVEIEFK
jgi:hypothetical protein